MQVEVATRTHAGVHLFQLYIGAVIVAAFVWGLIHVCNGTMRHRTHNQSLDD